MDTLAGLLAARLVNRTLQRAMAGGKEIELTRLKTTAAGKQALAMAAA